MTPHACEFPQCPNPTGMCECGCGETAPISIATIRKLGWLRDHPIRFILGHHTRTAELKAAKKQGQQQARARLSDPQPFPNPSGLCLCGCGEKTPIAKTCMRKLGWVKGQPVKYVRGHHLRTETVKAASASARLESPISAIGKQGEQNPYWKGGRTLSYKGYVWIKKSGHPRTNSSGYVPEHVLVLEEKLGRFLLPNEEGHHKNEIHSDNRPENLEALTKSEHRRLHNLTPEEKVKWFPCGHCGKPLRETPFYAKREGARFCSRACYEPHRGELTRGGQKRVV